MAKRQRLSQATRESRQYAQELQSFGRWVRNHRTSKKWTIEEAAERLDMDPTHLAKIEAGSINLSFVTLVRILRGMSLPSLTELLSSGTTKSS